MFSKLFCSIQFPVTDQENLLDNQIPKLVTISFILTTFRFDSRVTL